MIDFLFPRTLKFILGLILVTLFNMAVAAAIYPTSWSIESFVIGALYGAFGTLHWLLPALEDWQRR